jgi:hypothetical protein
VSPCIGSLIDGAANGGLSGADICVLEQTLKTADVLGLAAHMVSDLPIATVAGVIQTSQGHIIGIFHQYAHLGTGKTIHSATQLRQFGVHVCDTPCSLHGQQRIHHPDGYVIPLSIRNGLPYMDMYPPTDRDMDSYPHVIFTSDSDWDPTSLDHEYTVHDIDVSEDDLIPSFESTDVTVYGEIPLLQTHIHKVSPH